MSQQWELEIKERWADLERFYIPKGLVNDSQFPLKSGDPIIINVDRKGLRIEKKGTIKTGITI